MSAACAGPADTSPPMADSETKPTTMLMMAKRNGIMMLDRLDGAREGSEFVGAPADGREPIVAV